MQVRRLKQQAGFTLIEMLLVVAVMAVLVAILVPVTSSLRQKALAMQSSSNLRQLVQANYAYVADNGTFAPAQDANNLKRWHGKRDNLASRFDPTLGFLGPYLGGDGRIKQCPLLAEVLTLSEGSWEFGTGGYGYNAAYIGGTPAVNEARRVGTRWVMPFEIPERPVNVQKPAQTVMFTTTALAKSNGLQEYPYTEPFTHPRYGFPATPTTHFRADGHAIVAWCDGRVTFEAPNEDMGTNLYGGNNDRHIIGWYGPSEDNGFWNPYYE